MSVVHRVVACALAGTGAVVTSDPLPQRSLGLAIAPNGDVLTVDGGNGRIVETTPGLNARVTPRAGG